MVVARYLVALLLVKSNTLIRSNIDKHVDQLHLSDFRAKVLEKLVEKHVKFIICIFLKEYFIKKKQQQNTTQKYNYLQYIPIQGRMQDFSMGGGGQL